MIPAYCILKVQKMPILHFDSIDFSFDDLLANVRRKNGGREISEEMTTAAAEAYREGMKVLELRSSVEAYGVVECGGGYVALEGRGVGEKLFMGESAGWLAPAAEAAVVLSTAGCGITELMDKYAASGDYLTMYYLDAFGVQALGEISAKARAYVETSAAGRGWGIGPSMQPGSSAGWSVEGQRDLFRLGRGEDIGLSINDSFFLVPHISNSTLIGMGQHYSAATPQSMCGECPRFADCLWRKENVW